MAKIKLTKNELKVQKDALKMYQRYLPTLTLKKQQLQAEIRTIEAKAKAVREEKEKLEAGFNDWIAVFSEKDVFPDGIITVSNIRKGKGNIAGVAIPTYEGADFSRSDYDLYTTPLWVDIAANHMEKAMSLELEAEEKKLTDKSANKSASGKLCSVFEKSCGGKCTCGGDKLKKRCKKKKGNTGKGVSESFARFSFISQIHYG